MSLARLNFTFSYSAHHYPDGRSLVTVDISRTNARSPVARRHVNGNHAFSAVVSIPEANSIVDSVLAGGVAVPNSLNSTTRSAWFNSKIEYDGFVFRWNTTSKRYGGGEFVRPPPRIPRPYGPIPNILPCGHAPVDLPCSCHGTGVTIDTTSLWFL